MKVTVLKPNAQIMENVAQILIIYVNAIQVIISKTVLQTTIPYTNNI